MRSFTRRTVATVAATAMSAGLFLIAAPAMAATPAQATTSTVAAASDHDDYDYEDAEVVAVLEGAIKVRLDTGEIITLRVGPGCPILKGGVLVDLDSIHVGLEVDIDLGLSVNILGIIEIHGVAGLISIG
ncbi:hypothetical protein N8J89_33400 [Crossiella sp. CA-258035]|uniref:hypothetical protein n=1 Tax=Crossiella sp. CA-258035 TaxID=2981138 RepID=UPI0024BBF354|nr:hypothetical protein [Crossiella sp. CA-258035]WHT17971.1 hypothetical protein N8J89_33400 [Crossiella sp. CA-258035]